MLCATVGKFDSAGVTVGWIRNTLELEHFAVSENLRAEVEANSMMEVTGPAFELPFDADGSLGAWPV
jgi:hypothetical protein